MLLHHTILQFFIGRFFYKNQNKFLSLFKKQLASQLNCHFVFDCTKTGYYNQMNSPHHYYLNILISETCEYKILFCSLKAIYFCFSLHKFVVNVIKLFRNVNTTYVHILIEKSIYYLTICANSRQQLVSIRKNSRSEWLDKQFSIEKSRRIV